MNNRCVVPLVLAGTLLLAGCGGTSTSSAPSASSASTTSALSTAAASALSTNSTASASKTAQLTDDAKSKLPDFVSAFYEKMREGVPQQLSENSQTLLKKISGDSSSSTQQVIDSISKNLSEAEQQSIIDDMKHGADPLYSLIDHSQLSKAEDIVLSLFDISQSTTLMQQTATIDSAKLKVNVDPQKVIYDGAKASVPPSALSTELQQSQMASASATRSLSPEQEKANTLPLIWDGNQWKLDGKTYFQNQSS